MFLKSVNKILFVSAIIAACQMALFAQTAPVSGVVEMVKADGTREPVAGATVDAYRTDIKQSLPAAKTTKNGQFAFAGFTLGATYMLSVSAPGASPMIYPNIKAGMEKILITLSPGDGRKLTEAEARKDGAVPAAGEATGELTAEQKKAMAEHEAEVKKVTAKNEKALKTNEVVSKALKEGNEAFTAKNYDLAVDKYAEGIAADPEFVGSAPIFYNNRGTALMTRGVDTYNKSVKLPDPSAKVAGYTAVRKDFADAADSFSKSWTLLKSAPPADIPDKANYEAAKLGALKGAKDMFKVAVRTEQVDPAVIEAAKVLIPEYLAVESDSVKKAEASLILADLYRVTGDSQNAITAYKKILETSPDDQEALAGAGLSLVNLGYINTDKALLQEGSNLLQKFANSAPDSHKYKADALALIDTLKKEQNVTPQKVTTPARRKP